ncbi:MAG: hypothetical protein DRJ05_04665 [Bacteroidetes bacterium]|nr:MAG: hypothetical protein DRJ05_04665 [Bacteroidota bacterium]
MKQLSVKQSNYADLFNKNSSEPVLVKNTNDNLFLVLPLKQMNWQEIFLNLYQLPTNLFTEKQEKQIDLSEIDKLCGSMKGYLSSSDEFAKNKQKEIVLEDRKWKK